MISWMLVPTSNVRLLLWVRCVHCGLGLLAGLDDAAAVPRVRLRHRALTCRFVSYELLRVWL